jgi:hypothetical protein
MIALRPLTLYELLSIMVSIAGFAAVIITLLLMRHQTRDMTRQTQSVADSLKGTMFQSSLTQMYAVDTLFIVHPELRPYFYSGKDVCEGDPDYNKALAISELFLDYFGSILVQAKHFPQVWPANWWIPYFKDVFANSPVLCRYLESTSDWYQEELIDMMKEVKALRQERERQSLHQDMRGK